jgi:hypothetical protein
MDIDSAVYYLGIYLNTLENIVSTTSYLTKYADHEILSKSIPYMKIEDYEAYQKYYSHIREIDSSGCYRGKSAQPKYAPQEQEQIIKNIYNSMHYNGSSTKLYEFKLVKNSNANINPSEELSS